MNPLLPPLRTKVGMHCACFEGAARHLSMKSIFIFLHPEVLHRSLGEGGASKDAQRVGALLCFS